jgi:GTP-binding protein
MRFIDRVDVVVIPGKGGDGHVSFRREKYVPKGGPDGGDGGDGGDVVFRATSSRNTLQDFRTNQYLRGEAGEHGGKAQCTGRSGQPLLMQVPVGTVLIDLEAEELIADLDADGAEHAFKGGKGGYGNIRFKTATHQAPRESTPGEEIEPTRVRLELKLLADVGLLGFPNAGKSTLISVISAARPEIADYPFTTLVPNLGVVRVGEGASFVVADIPGLIEGAAEGRGLGHLFLRHVERCRALLHLVSAEPWEEKSVGERWQTIQDELAMYDEAVAALPQIPVLTKIDLVDADTRDALLAELSDLAGRPAIALSAVTSVGVADVVRAAWHLLHDDDDV